MPETPTLPVMRTCSECGTLYEVAVPATSEIAQIDPDDCDGEEFLDAISPYVCDDCVDQAEIEFWEAVDGFYAEHGRDPEPEDLVAELCNAEDGCEACNGHGVCTFCDGVSEEPDNDCDGVPCPCSPATCPDCDSELQGWTCDGHEGIGGCWEHGTIYAYHDEGIDCDGLDDLVDERPPGWCDRCSPEECECSGKPDTSDPDDGSRIAGWPWCRDCGEQGHAACCWDH